LVPPGKQVPIPLRRLWPAIPSGPERLVRGARGKVFLIVDNLKVHQAGKVQAWVAAHRERLALFFLPAYAPEHNPNELLHSAS
jgi:hypothetical protein